MQPVVRKTDCTASLNETRSKVISWEGEEGDVGELMTDQKVSVFLQLVKLPQKWSKIDANQRWVATDVMRPVHTVLQ